MTKKQLGGFLSRFLPSLVAFNAGESYEKRAADELAFKQPVAIQLANTAIRDAENTAGFSCGNMAPNHGAMV